jgi:hypothetical protein
MKASMIDGIITIAIGLFISLVAFRVIPISKDPTKADEWHARWGGFMKIAGPLIAAWGVFNILRSA